MLHRFNLPQIDDGNYEVQLTFTFNYRGYKQDFLNNQLTFFSQTSLLSYINDAYGQENDHATWVGGFLLLVFS